MATYQCTDCNGKFSRDKFVKQKYINVTDLKIPARCLVCLSNWKSKTKHNKKLAEIAISDEAYYGTNRIMSTPQVNQTIWIFVARGILRNRQVRGITERKTICKVISVDDDNFTVVFENDYEMLIKQEEEWVEWGIVLNGSNSDFTLQELCGIGSDEMDLDRIDQLSKKREREDINEDQDSQDSQDSTTQAARNKRPRGVTFVCVYGLLHKWLCTFFFRHLGDIVEATEQREETEYMHELFEESFLRFQVSEGFEGNFIEFYHSLDQDYEKVAFGRFLSQDLCNWTRHDDAKVLLASYKASRGGCFDIP